MGIGEKNEAYLAVKTSCYGDDASGLVVDGEHVGGRALGILGQYLVAQHSVGRLGVVLVHRGDGHDERACVFRRWFSCAHNTLSHEKQSDMHC